MPGCPPRIPDTGSRVTPAGNPVAANRVVLSPIKNGPPKTLVLTRQLKVEEGGIAPKSSTGLERTVTWAMLMLLPLSKVKT